MKTCCLLRQVHQCPSPTGILTWNRPGIFLNNQVNSCSWNFRKAGIRIRIRIDYWRNAETTIIHQDLSLGKSVLSSHQRSEFRNTILCIFSRLDQGIGEDIPIPDGFGEEATFTFINICISNGGLNAFEC